MLILKVSLERVVLEEEVVVEEVFELLTLHECRLLREELVVLVQQVGVGDVRVVKVCQRQPVVRPQKVPIGFLLVLVEFTQSLLEDCQIL